MTSQKKPPVVTIMGHVDHGKTSLLDCIRKSKLAAAEFGEITQAIGAYQIEFQGQKITFIDTPGHEAFTKMRRRGAIASDLVVLVVAANDGVMPQTKESIRIIKEADIPFIVAVNKIDLPEASIEKVKGQLAENEVFVEGYGGNVVVVPLSAKTGQGVDHLLEMILLTAEVSGFSADPQAFLKATVIEAKIDKNCGVMASLIVKDGCLKEGDTVWVDGACSKIRMLRNDKGERITSALPSDPVLVLGLCQLPEAGAQVSSQLNLDTRVKLAKEVKVGLPQEEKPKLKIVLKADVGGSLEAILGCLPEEVLVMEKAVGEIRESDVLLARSLGAEIYGFNLSVSSSVEKLAAAEKVKIKVFRIIYDLLKEIEKRVLKLLSPDIDRKVHGRAEIRQVFEMKGERIAGCLVIEGKINKTFPVMVKRGETILSDTKIVSLKDQKQDINEVLAGAEFGAILAQKLDFQPGDVVVSYSLEEN